MKLFHRAAAVAVICVSFMGSASAAELSLGIKGAANLANTWGKDKLDMSQLAGIAEEDPSISIKQTMKPGLIIGAFLETRLTENFSIQPEILYTSKGIKADISMAMDFMAMAGTAAFNLSYLEIPVLLKLNLPLGVAVPNVYAGPAVAFRTGIGGYAEMGGFKQELTDEMIDTVKQYTNSFDFGLAMGGGCNFVAGPGAVVLDIRYTLGFMQLMKLTDEMKAIGMTSSDLLDMKNTALSFMIGYALNIGG